MDLYPYGPVEEAVQKSMDTEMPVQKASSRFWQAILVTLLTTGIIFGIAYSIKEKEEKSGKKNQ